MDFPLTDGWAPEHRSTDRDWDIVSSRPSRVYVEHPLEQVVSFNVETGHWEVELVRL